MVHRGINQQEHPEIQQAPTHSPAPGNRQAGTRGPRHQLLGTALGSGGQQAELGPDMHPGSNERQQCTSSMNRTAMRATGRITPLLCVHQYTWNTALNAGKTPTEVEQVHGRLPRQRGWSPCPESRGCGTTAGSSVRRDGFGGTQQHLQH